MARVAHARLLHIAKFISHTAAMLSTCAAGSVSADEGRDEINAAEDPRTEYDKFVTLLTPCVVALNEYWKRRWTKRSVALREALDRPRLLRPGRNDSCSYRSGRKVKKCCYEI